MNRSFMSGCKKILLPNLLRNFFHVGLDFKTNVIPEFTTHIQNGLMPDFTVPNVVNLVPYSIMSWHSCNIMNLLKQDIKNLTCFMLCLDFRVNCYGNFRWILILTYLHLFKVCRFLILSYHLFLRVFWPTQISVNHIIVLK